MQGRCPVFLDVVFEDRIDVMKLLIENGVNVNCVDIVRISALFCIQTMKLKKKNIDTIKQNKINKFKKNVLK